MAEIQEYIPDLIGMDAEVFHENLDRELTHDEITEIRRWALGQISVVWGK